METPERLLRTYRTIAVVGMSRDPAKAAHGVPVTLAKAGFDVIPVNPGAPSIAGLDAYPTLAAVPRPIELVLVFRPSELAAGIAREAVAVGAKALWLQQGLFSDEARAIAEAAGLEYVEDRCAAVERALHQITKSRG
ncbi:MAG: CoA-binding protein [Myxococcota bacterium]|jgi:uncharacterized protein|nr:CoA-binding protein [Myxococcota bacterium]